MEIATTTQTPAPPPPAAPAESATSAQNPAAQAPATVTPDGEKPAQQPKTDQQEQERLLSRKAERRLNRAYREAAEQKARADLLEKRFAEIQQPAKPPVSGEPRLQDYDYDPEKYAAAKAEHAKSQTEKEFQSKQQTETAKQFEQRLVSSWEEKIEAVDEKYPDWNEKVGDLQPTTPFAVAIMEAENSADVAYFLGNNPKEATRIAQLHPLAQAREIGKIEAKLLAAPPQIQKPSQAPAPINPLAGTSPAVDAAPSDKDDTATWMQKRSKQVQARRR